MTQRVQDVNGWYEVKDNPLSRVGIFPYSGRSLGKMGADANRVFRVLRPEEELADPECLASFRLLPWVNDHTMLGPEDSGYTAAEVKGVQGVIGENVYFNSGVLYGNIKVFSDSLARLIAAGKTQLSAGYRCVYDWVAGTWNGQPYDCVQRTIRGNHLALVDEGRMGPSVAVLDHFTFTFDAKDAIMADPEKKDGGDPGKAGAMTLEQCAAMLAEIAPQVAKLNELMAAMGSKPAPAAAAPTDAAPKPGEATPAQPAASPTVTPDPTKAMDAALAPIREQLATLTKSLAAVQTGMDAMGSTLAADFAARDKLAEELADHVGTFDHADKTLAQVAAYGVEKLQIPAAKGSELVAVRAWLHGRAKPGAGSVRHAQDGKPANGDNFVTRHLAGPQTK